MTESAPTFLINKFLTRQAACIAPQDDSTDTTIRRHDDKDPKASAVANLPEYTKAHFI